MLEYIIPWVYKKKTVLPLLFLLREKKVYLVPFHISDNTIIPTIPLSFSTYIHDKKCDFVNNSNETNFQTSTEQLQKQAKMAKPMEQSKATSDD